MRGQQRSHTANTTTGFILVRSALRARRAVAFRAVGHVDQDEGGLLKGFAGKREGGQSRWCRYADVQTVCLVRRS